MENVGVLNQYQIEVSLLSGGATQHDNVEFADRITAEGKEPWTKLIQGLVQSGKLGTDSEVLDIGARYLSEIVYFREVLGLTKTIGLDLYTKDEELIKVGDMHDMPFPDSTFDLLFTRATHDKAYDIRKNIDETIRVMKPGGVIIMEDSASYIDGVTELARTDVKSTAHLLKMFGNSVGEVLHRRDLPSQNTFCRKYAFLAIEIKKT